MDCIDMLLLDFIISGGTISISCSILARWLPARARAQALSNVLLSRVLFFSLVIYPSLVWLLPQ